MPENPSPPDDDFADLFGKLPDPAARKAAAPERREPESPAPTSRRAAREQAGRSTPPDAGEPDVRAQEADAPAPTPTPAPAEGAAGAPRAASTGTLDDLFTGNATTRELGYAPAPPNRRKRRIGGWIALGVVLLLLGGVAAGGLWVWNTYENKIREFMGWEEPKDYEAGMAEGEVLVTIIPGDTGQSISTTLFNEGVTKTSDAFYDYLIDTNQSPPFEPGVFALQSKMTSAAALDALMDPANRRENTAQLREGLTVDESLPILSESLSIPLEDFQAAVADPTVYGVNVDPAIAAAGGEPLEGWLFPATYTFDPGVTATDVIGRLVNQTKTVLGDLGVSEEDRWRVLTTASIIQREARYEDDMQKVARVIENRLTPDISDTNGLLQMDSTAQYGYGEMHDGTVSSSGEALRDDNPWNTYVRTGLPVGPIANPGEAAINAALNPADGDWQYFVTVNLDTGETVFTSNLADHNRAVAQWQTWCRENPDSGC